MLLGLHKNLTFNSGKIYPYATGGDYVYLYEEDGKTYRVHEFLSTGTSTLNVEVGGQMDILVVGGGGGGGRAIASRGGGGGGAGGVLQINSRFVDNGTCTITVGGGGRGAASLALPALNGSNSSIVLGGITSSALGGGSGGGDGEDLSNGENGGCGGGGSWARTGGTGTNGQGFAGGNGNGFFSGYADCTRGAGGGGGAGGIGGSAPTPINSNTCVTAGNGGIGIWWLGKYYGGGGGGSGGQSNAIPGIGGLGGGGNGSTTGNGGSGTSNTGGGGGGSLTGTAGAGGSGIVIVRYVIAEKKLWTPSELGSSVAAWYDASEVSGLNNNDPITTWTDKSGNSRNVNNTNTNRPTYKTSVLNGNSVLEFDGSNDYLKMDSSFLVNLGESTIAWIARGFDVPALPRVLVGESSSTTTTPVLQAVRLYDATYEWTFRTDANVIYNYDTSPASLNTWAINLQEDTLSELNYAKNGSSYTQAGTYTRTTTTVNRFSIGCDLRSNGLGNPGAFFYGQVGEIIIIDGNLLLEEKQKLEGYLAHKWGLTNNLPAGHPYKYEPPYKVEPEEIVTENLVFNVDSGNYASYPRKGTTWYDLSGNGNHMTLYNPTYYAYDSESNSLDFSRNTSSNIGGYAEKTSPTGAISSQATFFAGNHSVEIWARLNDIQPTFYYNNSLTTEARNALFIYRGWHTMFYSSDTSLVYNLVYSADNAGAGVGAPIILDYDLQGKWFHAIAVKSGSTLYMYVNGVLVATKKLTSNSFKSESPVNLRISTGNAGSGSSFYRWYTESNISAARMYTKALSQTEVLQNFNALKGRYGTTLITEPSETVTSNLIIHLDTGNSSSYSGSGSTWTDLSGNGNNATLYNTPTYSSLDGGHLSFDGVNEYAEISASASTNLSASSITVSAWAKSATSTWSAYWSLVSKYNQFILGPNGQNEIAFLVYTSSGWQPSTYNNAIWGQSGTSFDNTQWHNYVGVYNSSSNLTILYIDGVAVAEVATVGAVSSDTGPIHLMHREVDSIGTNHLAGFLSNVQVYNRALSSYEILKNFNALRGRYGI